MKKCPESVPWLSFGGRRRLRLVRQATTTECGLACTAMLANFHGIATDLDALRRLYGASLKGATLVNIDSVCSELGLATRAVRCGIDELQQLATPCVLHWRFNHFVVLASVRKQGIVIFDPARGVVCESKAIVADAFTGVALEAKPRSGIRRMARPLQLKLTSLLSASNNLLGKFIAGLLLAFVCELLLLATPFYLQVVIDHVISSGDVLLLNALAAVFAVLLVFQVVANVMRQLTFMFLGYLTSFDMTARVLHRLFVLPVRFFRSRELGDIQHRVQSLRHIQEFVVQGMPALLLDAVFIVMLCVILFFYEPVLTLLLFGSLLLWCVWRTLIFRHSLRYANDIAQAESSVQTHFLESLRTMQTIKACNGEAQREAEWCDLFANASNARIRAGKLQLADGAVRRTLFQGSRIVAIYFLARAGLSQAVTVGAISAYVAYMGMFTTRGAGIVDRVMEYKLLDVPLARLADIVFSDEETLGRKELRTEVLQVTLKDISFTYSQGEAAVLQQCSGSFPDAALSVIGGVSGIGKSTLLQLIAGNEIPNDGEVLLNNCPAQQLNIKALRSQMATLFQDDALLRGSVAENIALFDREINMRSVRHAAKVACVAAEVEALPMSYETRIADLGSSLSCGQVQRILLARAYYRRPRLLLLDEPTSGLDGSLERDVVAALKAFPATKIVVSHSDLMLEAADEIYWLQNGKLLRTPPALGN